MAIYQLSCSSSQTAGCTRGWVRKLSQTDCACVVVQMEEALNECQYQTYVPITFFGTILANLPNFRPSLISSSNIRLGSNGNIRI